MSEHPSPQQLAQYQQRALPPDLFLSIHRHLALCADCLEQCDAASRLKEDYAILLAAVSPDPSEAAYHPAHAELAGYVQKNSDSVTTELVESHLEVCDECTRELATLNASALSNTPASAVQMASPQVGFLSSISWPLRLAAVLLLMLGALAAVLFFMRTTQRQPPARIERANVPSSSPEILANQNATSTAPDQPAKMSTTDQFADKQITNPEADIPDYLSSPSRQAILSAITTQRLEKPRVLADLTGTIGNLLSEKVEGHPFHLIGPIARVVQEQRPTFRWQQLAGATGYEVTIADEKLDEVATSPRLTTTEWRSVITLKPGATYSWQVTAFKDGQRITSPRLPAPQAKFRILDGKHSEELRRLKREQPGYHLGLGVLYTQAGLLEDAEREFQALSRDRSHSAIAEKLLRSVRSMKE
ncbi:MAG TPA: hypothetical protein VN643_15665 [Pyrinomonadaceae bacterium]|nr:hypothetical protein [Pyrinomonadaceae bacterium]